MFVKSNEHGLVRNKLEKPVFFHVFTSQTLKQIRKKKNRILREVYKRTLRPDFKFRDILNMSKI